MGVGKGGADEKMATVERLRPKGDLLRALDGRRSADETYVIQPIPIDAIEPDPNQPRMHFDPVELNELAASMKAVGLLQEPCVIPIEVDEVDGTPKRYRLHYGERRWRAAKIAGWTEIRCKVIPMNADQHLLERLKRIDQQEAENSKRAALSAVEEGKSIRVKLLALQEGRPDATQTALVEQIAGERKLDPTVVWRLLGLLDAPQSLQHAILHKDITSREVAFLLASHWKDLREKQAAAVQGKREVQFRNKVRDWASAKGLELTAETVSKYAAEQCLEPKVVRESLRAAEKIEKSATGAFDEVVATAVKESWTVQEARMRLRVRRTGEAAPSGSVAKLYERTAGKGRARFTVYTDRLQDPEIATLDARKELAAALRTLLAEVEATMQGPAASEA